MSVFTIGGLASADPQGNPRSVQYVEGQRNGSGVIALFSPTAASKVTFRWPQSLLSSLRSLVASPSLKRALQRHFRIISVGRTRHLHSPFVGVPQKRASK